jgi:hypothetical protein
MDNEKLALEFEFLREKLTNIARLLIQNNTNDLIEASFMIGCLHTICHEHSADFNKKHKESQNVDA